MREARRSWAHSALAMRRLTLPLRCVIAAGVSLAAFALRIAVGGWDAGSAYVPFLPVVVIATLLLGLAPGLLAAALGWVLAVVWFVEPVGGFRIDDWQDIAFAIFFPAAAAFAAVVAEVFLAASGAEDER
jgi:K+-sensing histidine kinase KdpD